MKRKLKRAVGGLGGCRFSRGIKSQKHKLLSRSCDSCHGFAQSDGVVACFQVHVNYNFYKSDVWAKCDVCTQHSIALLPDCVPLNGPNKQRFFHISSPGQSTKHQVRHEQERAEHHGTHASICITGVDAHELPGGWVGGPISCSFEKAVFCRPL